MEDMRGPQWASFSPLSKALADLVCSSLQTAYSARRIDCCHKNGSQIIATVHEYLAWVRTLLSVCWIGCDILGLDKAAQSMWAFVMVLHWLRKRQSKGKRWILFFEAFLDAQLVGCCSFIYLFIYLELSQALMCSVTFFSFDASGKMQKDLFCPLWD